MKQISSKNYTDTAFAGPITSFNLPIPALNFSADMRVLSDSATDVTIANMTSPIDAKEVFHLGLTQNSNVYSGTDIEPALAPLSKRGVTLLSQVKEVWTLTDTTDASFEQRLPVECHVVLKMPVNAVVSGADYVGLLARAVAGFFENGTNSSDRIVSMAKGALRPQDI